jgi:hypothetical protein
MAHMSSALEDSTKPANQAVANDYDYDYDYAEAYVAHNESSLINAHYPPRRLRARTPSAIGRLARWQTRRRSANRAL